MKHYEIRLANGHCPLTYECTTISEAYECLQTLARWHPCKPAFNLDGLMEVLVDMAKEKTLSHENHAVRIAVKDGEV